MPINVPPKAAVELKRRLTNAEPGVNRFFHRTPGCRLASNEENSTAERSGSDLVFWQCFYPGSRSVPWVCPASVYINKHLASADPDLKFRSADMAAPHA